MTLKNKFGIGTLLLAMLLVCMVFVPAVNAATVNDKSDIINNIDFDKRSLTKFNETLDNFETVTTNPTSFLNDVSDGQVTLELL